MVDRFVDRLQARLRFAALNLSWAPTAAALLVGVTAVTQLVILPARRAALDDAEQRLLRLEQRLRAQASAPASASASPDEARTRLLERFPSQAQLNAELGRLIELAAVQDVHLTRGDYRLVPEKDGLFDRYVLTLPAKGQYAHIRRYVEAVRGEFPELAVDDLTLRRETIGSGEVEAQLRFVLFGRKVGP